jgi:hypothetical protein
MKRDDRIAKQAPSAVSLPGEAPYVDPRVPKGALTPADAYKAGLQARAQARLAKTQMPVAGGPGPRIPRLDSQPSDAGMTMQQHAMTTEQRNRQLEALRQASQKGSFVEPPPVSAPRLVLQKTDTLPQEARQDPSFIAGYGDMIAVNQPQLAAKYGVVRDGKVLAPQQLLPTTGKPQLRPETIKDLETLKRLEEEQLVIPEAPTGLGDAAGKVGNLPGDDSSKPLSENEKKELQKAVASMDEFEFDNWRQTMMKDILNQPEQKRLIEARLAPMDIGDLITMGHIIQNVPIIPGKFEVQFRTNDGETDLAIKRLIMEESKSLEVSERYYLDKFAMMSMTALLYAINKKVFPDHHNEKGEFDDERFRKKFQFVLRLPFHMLASIGVQAMWFEERVRKLFVVEKVGNG